MVKAISRGVIIEAVNFIPEENELKCYVDFVREKAPDVSSISVYLLGDDTVDIKYTVYKKFERIRRVTGYLTGDLRFWNDAKQAEERDRLKHLGD